MFITAVCVLFFIKNSIAREQKFYNIIYKGNWTEGSAI